MKKQERKKEELFKKLYEIIDKLDSYEEIYPDKEVEELNRMEIKTINQLKEIASFFQDTEIEKNILHLIDIEKSIQEGHMLTEEDITKALYLRDILLLMSSSCITEESKIEPDLYIRFCKKRKESLLSALTQNNRAAYLADSYKKQRQIERNSYKIMIYLSILEEIIKRQEAKKIG
ncbi:MAG: hypothetical protein IJA36_06085 [Lachnospiraceae bacterium]|nr:hypothetical protein [Lachnospiraceae bacterium]